VRDGVITRPVRVFAPGFGAGAVAGYAVLRIDPAVVAVGERAAPEQAHPQQPEEASQGGASTSEDVHLAFG
jgi:hypothetical protein